MTTNVKIDAGICGFSTEVKSSSNDAQHVNIEITTDCDKIASIAEKIKEENPLDAFAEISPVGSSKILSIADKQLTGCCAGCAVPVGMYKAMQVAAGLALPKDIAIKMTVD